MAHTIPQVASTGHLSRLENLPRRQASANLKNLDGWRQRAGEALAIAIRLAHLTRKEAAALIGRDEAQLARWISGAERLQLDAILAVEQLRAPMVIAQALLEPTIDVTTHIAIRRLA